MTKTPRMVYLRALTRIESRFATTLVSNKFVNEDDKAAEATFTVTLPEAAFISHFTMRVDGKTIVGEVKEKQKAKVQYERAKERGESAGHIAQALRETNVFHISTNIAAGGEAIFNLTYQEILQRVHGAYKHVINIQAQQAVNDLKVDVFIKESQPIKTIKVAKFGQKVGEKINVELLAEEEEKSAKIDISHQSTAAHISSAMCQQLKRGKSTDNWLFCMTLKDKRTAGSFRWSMATSFTFSRHPGCRQLQNTFNILAFSDFVEAWKPESVRATPAAVESAIKHSDKINASRRTNIHQVLKDSLAQFEQLKGSLNNCMVILLTDGQPTMGHCSTEAIVGLTKEQNKTPKVSIQCIGFGEDADFELLKKLSMENEGLARRVYEDSDAALQLQGFYAEISQLLLSDVKIKYLDERVQPDSIIQESSRSLYNGGEFAVVGRMRENVEVDGLTAQIDCLGMGGLIEFKCGCTSSPRLDDVFKPSPTVPLPAESVGGFVERMWAYLSIKQLLDKAKYESSGNESEQFKQRALQLSLKYQFVTELTSMVVTQPEKQIECCLAQFVTQSGGLEPRTAVVGRIGGGMYMAAPGGARGGGAAPVLYTFASVVDSASDGTPRTENNKDMSTRYSYAGCKSDSESESEKKHKENNKDINSRLVQMPLGEFVQQDWALVMPLLEAETINSLPLAKLSAIPWDDVIVLMRAKVFGGLSESVLKSFPTSAWSKVTVEQLNHLPPPMFIALTGDAVKHIPKENLKQINRETVETMPQEASL